MIDTIKIPPTHRWVIEDETLVDLLIKNGFVCHKATINYGSGPSIHICTETQAYLDESKFYDTDCPIEFNRKYVLPDKTVIESNGTLLCRV